MAMRGSARIRKTTVGTPDVSSRSGGVRAAGSAAAERPGQGPGPATVAAQTVALAREFDDAGQSQRLSEGEARELRTALRRLAPIAEEVARLFYSRLFELDPNLHYLFGGDLGVEVDRLAGVLEAGAAGDRGPDEPFFPARGPGLVPSGSEISAGHRATFVRALASTLEEALGEEPTEEAARAWTKLGDRLFPMAPGAAPAA